MDCNVYTSCRSIYVSEFMFSIRSSSSFCLGFFFFFSFWIFLFKLIELWALVLGKPRRGVEPGGVMERTMIFRIARLSI